MRELRRLAWATAILAITTPAAFGQVTGTTAGGGTTGTTGGGLNIGGAGGTGGTGAGGAGGGGAGGMGTAGNSGTTLATQPGTPKISAPSNYATTSSNTAVNASNFLGPTYANPYYQGTRTNATNANATPGGFGTALFGTSGGRGGGNIGSASATTTTAGGRGGATGAGGTGSVNVTDPGGVLVPIPRQIAYPAIAKFPAPAVAPVALQTDVKGVIDRSIGASVPGGVQVIVEGTTVTLRGTVKDADDFRFVEGLARLTPGVGVIRNELTYPGKQ